MWLTLLALWIVAQLVAAPLIGRRLACLREAQSRTIPAARGDASREVPVQFAVHPRVSRDPSHAGIIAAAGSRRPTRGGSRATRSGSETPR